MRKPWTVPEASGEAPGDGHAWEWATVAAARRPDSLLGDDSALLAEFDGFAKTNHLAVMSHKNGPLEQWSFLLNYDRMQREVLVILEKLTGGLDVSVRAFAVWYAANEDHQEIPQPLILYAPKEERSQARLNGGDLPRIRRALTWALDEAKHYRVDDLQELPLGCHPELHH